MAQLHSPSTQQVPGNLLTPRGRTIVHKLNFMMMPNTIIPDVYAYVYHSFTAGDNTSEQFFCANLDQGWLQETKCGRNVPLMSPLPPLFTPQIRDIGRNLAYCGPAVCAAGPIVNQHWVYVWSLQEISNLLPGRNHMLSIVSPKSGFCLWSPP